MYLNFQPDSRAQTAHHHQVSVLKEKKFKLRDKMQRHKECRVRSSISGLFRLESNLLSSASELLLKTALTAVPGRGSRSDH